MSRGAISMYRVIHPAARRTIPVNAREIVAIEFMAALRANASEKRMSVQQFQLLLWSVTRRRMGNQLIPIPAIPLRCPKLPIFSLQIGIFSKIQALVTLHAIGVNATNNVNRTRVEKTAIALFDFGHGLLILTFQSIFHLIRQFREKIVTCRDLDHIHCYRPVFPVRSRYSLIIRHPDYQH